MGDKETLLLWLTIPCLVFSILFAVFKGYVVRSVARDPMQGGGVPTADFFIIYPFFIAFNGSMILWVFDALPFPGFGYVLYGVLLLSFTFLYWWFHHIGKAQRQRPIEPDTPPDSGE